jgi:hypothetical protein
MNISWFVCAHAQGSTTTTSSQSDSFAVLTNTAPVITLLGSPSVTITQV